MKPYIQRICHAARADAVFLVEISDRDENTLLINVLDLKGDVNLLMDIADEVDEIGIVSWMASNERKPRYSGTFFHRDKIISKRPLNYKYVDYRAVDPLHVDKLMSISVSTMSYSQPKLDGVDACHFIDGITVLPGNFVLASTFNKVVSNKNFVRAIGEQVVAEKLGRESRDKLFELEGYRLFRNLNTLDDLLSIARHGIDLSYTPTCEANSAPYIEVCSGIIYIIPPQASNTTLSPDYAANVLNAGCYFIPRDVHFAMKGILNSYIERR